MQILIAGASGLIGTALTAHFRDKKYEIWGLTRNKSRAMKSASDVPNWIEWDGMKIPEILPPSLTPDVIINLAGQNLASGYWTAAFKRKLRDSRIQSARSLVILTEQLNPKPALFLQVSAVGYYGSRGDEILDDFSGKGRGFLSDLAADWESETRVLENAGIRCCRLRLGPVLSARGGMLSKMLPPFRFFLGGPIGSGQQWISWIHIQDVVNAVQFLMDTPGLDGAFNFSAPEPRRISEFTQVLGQVMGRPAWLPAPEFILNLFLGDMAREMVLSSQRALPKRLVTSGYNFVFPTLPVALADLLDKREIL